MFTLTAANGSSCAHIDIYTEYARQPFCISLWFAKKIDDLDFVFFCDITVLSVERVI